VKKSYDLRKILSGNIRAVREALHITQAKLAEHADIALPSLIGIEHRKTWVSDKTLIKIARALNNGGLPAFDSAGKRGLLRG
jgi:transcriptional regulator with XRE-family HTH domain